MIKARKIMARLPATFVYGIIAASALTVQPASARSVEVKAGQTGQGFLFSTNGTCYLVTAGHVLGGKLRAQIFTEAGEDALAIMSSPFWPEMDLAVGQIQRPPPTGCGPQLADLARLSADDLQDADVTLPFVAAGKSEVMAVRLNRASYLVLTGVAGNQAQVQKGVSGAMLLADGKPAGIAQSVTPDGTITFLRIEEAAMNLQRFLSRRPAPTALPEPTSQASVATGLWTLISATPAGQGADGAADLLASGEGAWIIPDSGPAEIILRSTAEGDALLRELTIDARPEAEGETAPRVFRIDVRAGETAPWRFYAAGDIPPDGLLRTGRRAPAYARDVRVQIRSRWTPGPVRVRSIAGE